jgi:chromosome segregation ATPase
MQLKEEEILELFNTCLNYKYSRLKDITSGQRFASLLYSIDPKAFPFLSADSVFYIGEIKQQPRTLEQYRQDEKYKWLKIISCLTTVDRMDSDKSLEEFKKSDLDSFLNDNEISVLYFATLIIIKLTQMYPKIASKAEKEQPHSYQTMMRRSVYESNRKDSSQKLRQSNEYSTTSVQESPPRKQRYSFREKKDYIITDKSVKDLVKTISELQKESTFLKEEVLYKQNESFALQEKVKNLTTELRLKDEELESKENMIFRLGSKLEAIERIQKDERMSTNDKRDLEITVQKNKIEDLYAEIDTLMKQNQHLKHRYEQLSLKDRMPVELPDGFDDEVSTETLKMQLKNTQLEIEVYKGKMEALEHGITGYEIRLLKEREENKRITDGHKEIHKALTERDLMNKRLQSELSGKSKELEHLKDRLVQKEFELKRLEHDYVKVVQNYKCEAQSIKTTTEKEDSVHQLVAVSKEMNRCYLAELKILYSLLHDTFVSELTGESLQQVVNRMLTMQDKTLAD